MKYKSPRFANYEFDFERINVVLGANGAGKSKLLIELRDFILKSGTGEKVVFIEGGRTITIVDVLQLDAKNFNQFDRLETAIAQHEKKRSRSLASRVFDALIVLEKRDLHIKSSHSDAVEKWVARGKSGDYPKRPAAPLARLFELFSEIFPQIGLSYDYGKRRLLVEKNGAAYGPSTLSDGEKQVFSILADLIELEAAHKIIVADEPELNLHPELAERLWTLVENEFQEKTFIYATHSIHFSLRTNVQKVYILSSDAQNIAQFTGLDALPRHEMSALLGSLPGILSANRVIVTEGHEKSFDAIFYRWLLDDPRLEIYPAGGCTDVEAVATKTGLWDKISTHVALSGVIDSDFRGDEYLSSRSAPNVTVLPLHEAESYLCLPNVAVAIAERIGSQEVPLKQSDVVDMILDRLKAQRLAIAARRVIARSRIHLAVSVERKVLSKTSSREALVAELRTAATNELQKASSTIGPEQIETEVDRELALIDDAIACANHIKALRLVPGKQLLGLLAPRVGCKSGADFMRSLRRNFRPADFTEIEALRTAIGQERV